MKIPRYVLQIVANLTEAGYEAYPVGGGVRDLLLGKTPKDWDITTSALPEQVLAVFNDAKYENIFGTVLVAFRNDQGVAEAVVEVTTFRSEQGYSDRRHPDEITFENIIDKDLERRDFTINAMALKIRIKNQDLRIKNAIAPSPCEGRDSCLVSSRTEGEGRGEVCDFLNEVELQEADYEIIDLFGGRKDLHKKIIRAVGEPVDRFKEDALRMMRAIRFSAQLGFEIEDKTKRGIAKLAQMIRFVANERIRDELIKIMNSKQPAQGIRNLHETKLLQYVLPELEAGVGVAQNKHHRHTVYEHNLRSLEHCPSKDWRVRFATLLHDVAKPKVKNIVNGEATFYNHEYVGAKIVAKIVKRLKFSTEDADKVIGLVKNHMFYYNVDEVTEAAVRRLIVKVGKENLKDLIDLRIGDRLGSEVAKAKPYKLRHLEYMFDKVQDDPVSVKMLKINGDVLMSKLALAPGPKIGCILDVLLAEVIEAPEFNTEEWLLNRSFELQKYDLDELREKAKSIIAERRVEDDTKIKKKHWVK